MQLFDLIMELRTYETYGSSFMFMELMDDHVYTTYRWSCLYDL